MISSQLAIVRRRKKRQIELLVLLMVVNNVVTLMYLVMCMMGVIVYEIERPRYSKSEKKHLRQKHLDALIKDSDIVCKSELRVNRKTFYVLCEMVRDVGGLNGTRNISLEEIVAMFLYTLAHHLKNRTIRSHFFRSGESVSRNFHRCLLAVLKLHTHLLKKPTPITEDCEVDRWKCFKNCLGALDGTHISVHVPSEDSVCNPNLEFIYVQPGWEGSAHDGRVLRDVITRPNGLKVPQGSYYLVDAGYTNCEGFLAPYRGHPYHLKEWGDRQPISAEEYFNMKHSKARNVIERCFGLLKGRWGILRTPSFFPIRTHGRIVQACVLLHNLIRKHMPTDYTMYWDFDSEEGESDDEGLHDEVDLITQIATTNAWTAYRNNLAQTMMNVGQFVQSGRGKNKRSWNKSEEECLINGLLEMSADPSWKADGSFKGGYKNKLEEKLNEKFPECGLKVIPHIESKIKWFKDKYNVLTEMFLTYGFSWDNEKNMIVCERQSYEEFCKQHRNAQRLWNVPFPFYDQLSIIFGADRATGVQSDTFVEAVDNQEKETIELDKGGSDEDDEFDDYESVNQSKESTPSEPSSKKAKKEKAPNELGRKRKKPEVVDLTSMNKHMSTIASAFSTTQLHEQAIMAREEVEENKKENLVSQLLRIEGLTRFEIMEASKRLASNPSELSLFYQCPDDEWKKEFIINLIHPNLDK
ncbi:uncharacterized protein LOC130813435 [Amaranthus tricolor]|uniref:uncharacterized protein LOC130813435 n=1 Tax=Amaranthus tricolor TaxID=29722 RepID=UPI00258DAF57|nr:uncharacterized protein LOC130813435 [Amaranthus tricolor]